MRKPSNKIPFVLEPELKKDVYDINDYVSSSDLIECSVGKHTINNTKKEIIKVSWDDHYFNICEDCYPKYCGISLKLVKRFSRPLVVN